MMPSVVLTLTKASMALRMGDLMMYEHEMDSYKEVKSAESTSCSCFAKPKAGRLACSCILQQKQLSGAPLPPDTSGLHVRGTAVGCPGTARVLEALVLVNSVLLGA